MKVESLIEGKVWIENSAKVVEVGELVEVSNERGEQLIACGLFKEKKVGAGKGKKKKAVD